MRVFGHQLAELPLVATRYTMRRQGHAHVLITAVEGLLAAMGVQTLCLPAAQETVRGSYSLPVILAKLCHIMNNCVSRACHGHSSSLPACSFLIPLGDGLRFTWRHAKVSTRACKFTFHVHGD